MYNGTVNLFYSICSVPGVDDFLHVVLADRVETDNAAIERSVELEILLLRAFHVHNVDRVVLRHKKVFVSLVLYVLVFVQGADKRDVRWLWTFVMIEAAWYKPSLFDGFFFICAVDMLELFRTA